MKITYRSVTLMLAFVSIISSCSMQKRDEALSRDKTFRTPEQAVAKAKSDLIQILETKKDLNLGINLSKLREAQQATPIRHVELDFRKILRADSVASLTDVASADKGMIVPFVLDNEVVGIAKIGKVSGGWNVIGLANKIITNDLNQTGLVRRRGAPITLYEVPNLKLMIYAVKGERGEDYRLNLERFTLKESVAISELYPTIRKRAIQFNKQFGDQLKRTKLVD
ncbi:MAG: hypothetical protein GY845_12225 [Planctomycetes bacterium]|nr:hypothetical protein [Planctomycetota bacterium]